MNLTHSNSENTELLKNAIRLIIRQGGPQGVPKEKILDHFRKIGSNMGLVSQLLSEVMSEQGIKITKGNNQ